MLLSDLDSRLFKQFMLSRLLILILTGWVEFALGIDCRNKIRSRCTIKETQYKNYDYLYYNEFFSPPSLFFFFKEITSSDFVRLCAEGGMMKVFRVGRERPGTSPRKRLPSAGKPQGRESTPRRTSLFPPHKHASWRHPAAPGAEECNQR